MTRAMTKGFTSAACVLLTIGALAADAPSSLPEGFIIARPDELRWQASPTTPGLQQAILAGDPTKPGMYVLRVKFAPGVMTRPHIHNEDRYVAVLQGTWWVGTGSEFEPGKTTPLRAGSFMKHPAGAQHYDGAKDEEVIVQIIGMGAASTTFVKPELGPTGNSLPAKR